MLYYGVQQCEGEKFYLIPINKIFIKNVIKGTNSKHNKGKDNSDLYAEYASSVFNYNDTISDETEYNIGNWIEHTDRWIHNRLSPNKRKYGRGTIVMVDLGATNFGSEPSYLHPAVIVAENTFFVLIVPASTQKYGKGYSDIIDATSADGFHHDTGVQSKSYRWVSKSRIESVMGKASSRLLDEIDNSMLKDVPMYKKNMAKKDADIKALKNDNEELNKEVLELKDKIEKLELQLTSNTNNGSI